MAVPERLWGVDTDQLNDVVLPALRGHLGIRSGELTTLARERGLVVPAGEPAARGEEWVALLQTLAGVAPLTSVGEAPIRLMPVARDLSDLVDGSVAPVAWWQRLLGGGSRPPSLDPVLAELRGLVWQLADGLAMPPELVRPLIGRFNGQLTLAEVTELHQRLTQLGRERWLATAAGTVNAAAWPTCYDQLLAATGESMERGCGLLYDSGY